MPNESELLRKAINANTAMTRDLMKTIKALNENIVAFHREWREGNEKKDEILHIPGSSDILNGCTCPWAGSVSENHPAAGHQIPCPVLKQTHHAFDDCDNMYGHRDKD